MFVRRYQCVRLVDNVAREYASTTQRAFPSRTETRVQAIDERLRCSPASRDLCARLRTSQLAAGPNAPRVSTAKCLYSSIASFMQMKQSNTQSSRVSQLGISALSIRFLASRIPEAGRLHYIQLLFTSRSSMSAYENEPNIRSLCARSFDATS